MPPLPICSGGFLYRAPCLYPFFVGEGLAPPVLTHRKLRKEQAPPLQDIVTSAPCSQPFLAQGAPRPPRSGVSTCSAMPSTAPLQEIVTSRTVVRTPFWHSTPTKKRTPVGQFKTNCPTGGFYLFQVMIIAIKIYDSIDFIAVRRIHIKLNPQEMRR